MGDERSVPIMLVTARVRTETLQFAFGAPPWDEIPPESLVPLAAAIQGRALDHARVEAAARGLPAPKLRDFTWLGGTWQPDLEPDP